MDRARIPELPDAMANRAAWSRQRACEDPTRVEIDHEFLPWVFCEEDNLWYSFDGNYSGISPDEKRIKAIEFNKKQEAWEEKQRLNVRKRYLYNLYWSEVRYDILTRDKNTCQLCGVNGNNKLHIHHILKRKKGGKDYYDNLLTVCPKCHSKADSDLYDPEWIEE